MSENAENRPVPVNGDEPGVSELALRPRSLAEQQLNLINGSALKLQNSKNAREIVSAWYDFLMAAGNPTKLINFPLELSAQALNFLMLNPERFREAGSIDARDGRAVLTEVLQHLSRDDSRVVQALAYVHRRTRYSDIRALIDTIVITPQE